MAKLRKNTIIPVNNAPPWESFLLRTRGKQHCMMIEHSSSGNETVHSSATPLDLLLNAISGSSYPRDDVQANDGDNGDYTSSELNLGRLLEQSQGAVR